MGAFQEKFLAELRKLAQSKKVDFDVEYEWANTGCIYFRKGFKTLSTLHFSFQSSSAKLTDDGICQRGTCYFTDFHINYRNPEESVNQVMDFVEVTLDSALKKLYYETTTQKGKPC